jgi:hypothetical protein
MTYKAKNRHTKEMPWLILDIFPAKKVPNVMENTEVLYCSLPVGPNLEIEWKTLQAFFQFRTGYEQVISGY